MYKMMVVDDEQIVLDAVKFIAEHYMENIKVIATARTGREAIEKVSIEKPDIVLMDIKMPGINGIEAIKEIQSRYYDIKFIIVSAYEQFEFAREAVAIGVKQYILKPINRYKLIETVNNIVEELEHENEKKEKELKNIEKLDKIIPVLEQGFIYSILMNRDFSGEITQYKELFEINEDGGYIMVLQFGEGDKASSLKNKIGSSIKSQSFYPYFRDLLKYKRKCIIGPVMLNRIIVFVSAKKKENEYSQRVEAVEFAEYIAKKLERNSDIEFFIGIGSYKKFENINYSYDEAIKALWYNKGERALHIMDITAKKVTIHNDLRNTINKLIEYLEIGKVDTVNKILGQMFDNISKINIKHSNSDMIDEEVRNKLMELMVIVHRAALDGGVKEDVYLSYDEYLMEMASINNYKTLKLWCVERINYITQKIKEIKENKVSKVIEQAKEFIKDRFSEDITLEEISKEVSISPQYFSRLFKQEIGCNFIEYLTTVRINKAKELLASSNMSIKEICYAVGYGDPNYFSRLFKKNVGVSPTEYLKNGST